MFHPRPRRRRRTAVRALLDFPASSVQRAGVPAPEEDDGRVDGRDEPQQHIHQIHPYGVLHALLAVLLGRGSGRDVDATEGAEYCCPEDTTWRALSERGCAGDVGRGRALTT